MAPTDSPHDASYSQAEQEDLDPQSFLIAVRELSEKKEREDEERYRKLEEEVIKGREERAARRAGTFLTYQYIFMLWWRGLKVTSAVAKAALYYKQNVSTAAQGLQS